MPKSEIYISYPPEGKKVIPAGMLEIDWKNGIAYLPDGNKEALSALLPPDKIMKSLLIMTEHTGILKLLFGEQKNIHAPVFPSMSTIRNIFFDRTLFEVSEASRIYMLASTDPTGPSIDEMRQPMPVVFGYASEWESLWEVDEIPPGKVVAYDAYTVPEGHRLLFKGGYAFCSIGCVQKVFLTKTPGILGSFYFTRTKPFSFEPSSEVTEGKTVTYYFQNNSTKKCYGGITLIGVLEKIA